MLISFSIENWMSFGNLEKFSMVATKERQHRERVIKLLKYKTSILPVATIYGGNASGKTNLFRALNFVKKLIVKGTQPDAMIPIQAFKLDSRKNDQPTRFITELLIDDFIFEYSFSVTAKEVIEEKLSKINSTSKVILYTRSAEGIKVEVSCGDKQFLDAVSQGTRPNQLFLTNAVSQNAEKNANVLKRVYDWFKDTLQLIAPDARFSKFEQLFDENDSLFSAMNKILPQLGMGISHIANEEVPFVDSVLPAELKAKIQQEVAKKGVMIKLENNRESIILEGKNGEIVAKKLATYHTCIDGSEVKFDLDQESDGTRRAMDLLPAFIQLSENLSKKVFIVDEIDRSLHTLLTRKIIEMYLAKCSPDSRSQLLFTTHDVLLMDQELFRRDEMWIIERDKNGSSHMISFSDFKDVRYDKDIRKSYLQGRLGGIPSMSLNTRSGL